MPDITNPYDAVIADLEAKRAEIDAAVRLMKKLRDRIGMSVADDAGSGWKDEIQLALGAENDIPSDAFFGMTIADAAVKYLGKWTNRKPQSTKAIIEALGRGGLKGKAYPTVYGILNRRKEREGDVVNVHGDWGLAEWYGAGPAAKKQRRKKSGIPVNDLVEAEEEENAAKEVEQQALAS